MKSMTVRIEDDAVWLKAKQKMLLDRESFQGLFEKAVLDYIKEETELDYNMTGNEYLEKYNCNPSKVEFEGKIYNETDLASMDSEDYEEIMEYGKVTE